MNVIHKKAIKFHSPSYRQQKYTVLNKPVKYQNGISVAIAMIFLVMLTSMGFTALWISAKDEKLVGIMQQEVISFQGAETGQSILWKNRNELTTAQTRGTANKSTINLCASVTGECLDSTPNRLKTIISIDAWYLGESGTAPSGFSLDSGVASHYFVQESKGKHGAIETRIESGYYIAGPRTKD